MKKGLIIGLGIGNLYKEQMLRVGITPFTVDNDPSKSPDFTELSLALLNEFDVAVICTPNYTHLDILNLVAPRCKHVIVEKPGLANELEWMDAAERWPDTHIAMAKNNIYRPQFLHLGDMFHNNLVKQVHITWSSSNRIPSPGSWFTTKSKAFGGVHRDLMPHLIHMAYALSTKSADEIIIKSSNLEQHHTLDTLTDTDYGDVDLTGTYDVDDYAELELEINDIQYNLLAEWKSDQSEDMQVIHIEFKDGTYLDYTFGLCPNYCYGDMLTDIVDFEEEHRELDQVVHHIMDRMTANG